MDIALTVSTNQFIHFLRSLTGGDVFEIDHQHDLVPLDHVRADEPKLVALEPGRQPQHEREPRVQYHHRSRGELQLAALQRRDGATYFSQIFGMIFLQFVSAATGMAAAAMVFNALRERTSEKRGNLYDHFLKSLTRVLLPLAVVVVVMLMFSGTPQTAGGRDSIVALQGDSVDVSLGPVAGFVAIKHLSTNGGGYYGTNSAHPLGAELIKAKSRERHQTLQQ